MQIQLLDLFDPQPLFNNFVPLKNELLVHSLSNFSRQFTHIAGTSNSGKTHLLKAWVHLAKSNKFSATYIDMKVAKTSVSPSKLLQYDYIAIDNIDLLTSRQQISLFDLYNKIKQNSLSNMLLTSSCATLDKLSLRADLITRLQAGLDLNLKVLDDEEILQALNHIANTEGIGIGNDGLKFLITHYNRNVGQLVIAVRNIADMAVTEKRNITIPLIKKTLEI
jgi:DnaA family protein